MDSRFFDFEEFYSYIAFLLPPHSKICEVGNYVGASITFLAQELDKLGKTYEIVCIDNFSYHMGQKQQFLDNTQHINNLLLYEGDSISTSKLFEDNTFDFIFLDSCHDYDHVRKELPAYRKKLKVGGYLGGHDFIRIKDVELAVRDFLPLYQIDIFGTKDGWGCWLFKNEINKSFKQVTNNGFKDYLVYIPYVNGIDFFDKAVSNHNKNIFCVDQSNSGDLDKYLEDKRISIYRNNEKNYCKSFNLALEYCYLNGINRMFFQHHDGFINDISIVDKMLNEIKDNATFFTHYDVFCLLNLDEIYSKVGVFDESFYWYMADIDYYHRVKMHSSTCEGYGDKVSHNPSSTLKYLSKNDTDFVNSNHDWAKKHFSHKWGHGGHIPYNRKV